VLLLPSDDEQAVSAKRTLPLVVFSHLRWDFVYQRPQHVVSRLAKSREVVFVEEPAIEAGVTPSLDVEQLMPGLVRCRPRLPAGSPGFSDDHRAKLAELLGKQLSTSRIDRHAAWLYTPMALSLATALCPEVVVYDCMDELSLFKGAPAGLLDEERRLLERADVVFTGGPSLYRAKRARHGDVHNLPSSVDVAHFSRARDALAEPADQRALPHPRLGYFGVLDERIDPTLINEIAVRHPEWQIVLIGPVVKIESASLPRHPNVHYLGQRAYADLPAYLSGWDVCLLPFALNDATRFISPTKTLEYMAAERPIVSTSVRDVADLYGDVVHLANTPAEFVSACEVALTDRSPQRRAAMQRLVSRTSWDLTVRAMDTALRRACRRRDALKEEGSTCLDTTRS
jgi:UDP-galactopyranose mutase